MRRRNKVKVETLHEKIQKHRGRRSQEARELIEQRSGEERKSHSVSS